MSETGKASWIEWVLGGLGIAGIMFLLAICFHALQVVKWIGSGDLIVEFVVCDASGIPISDAVVEIDCMGDCGRHHIEEGKRRFSLKTDAAGRAMQMLKDNTRIGSSGTFVQTVSPYVPEWAIRVVAEGFEPTEWATLVSTPDAISHDSEMVDRVTMRIEMKKIAPR